MLMYAWMKFVELAPERYDFAVKIMTGGRLDHIKDCIAAEIQSGQHVLDVGCGTGTLALRCLKRGAYVTGYDNSECMLKQAERNVFNSGLSDHFTMVKDSVTQLEKHFGPASFDAILFTMVLGEFPGEYLNYIFSQCNKILRPGGRLIIADEVWPETRLGKIGYQIIMAMMWIPQFILLRRVTYPISNLRTFVQNAGFAVRSNKKWPGTSFQLISSQK